MSADEGDAETGELETLEVAMLGGSTDERAERFFGGAWRRTRWSSSVGDVCTSQSCRQICAVRQERIID